MYGVRIEVDTSGLNLNAAAFDGPIKDFLTGAAKEIEAQTKAKAPVDTGALQRSITSTIGSREAEIGPTVDYAIYMERGTHHSRMPPPAALEGWASRHGMTGFGVARGILARGGLKPRWYMRDGLANSMGKIRSLTSKLAKAIVDAI